MKVKSYLLLIALSLLMTGRLFAAGEEMPPPPDQSYWQTLVMLAIAFLFFYVIFLRPDQKRRKAWNNSELLKKGDRVAAMGIIGTVVKIGEQTVSSKWLTERSSNFIKRQFQKFYLKAKKRQKNRRGRFLIKLSFEQQKLNAKAQRRRD